ncbi:hypothetical protein LMH73_016885 [Vibrio splendidus]|nr:hypothetical protein [Vibrio splendidus]MCC4881833.1 hypothetical protein [Vibrio splendidus]
MGQTKSDLPVNAYQNLNAEHAAGLKTTGMAFNKWIYTYRSNPFEPKTPEHIEWHNEFYDACKRLGRSVK